MTERKRDGPYSALMFSLPGTVMLAVLTSYFVGPFSQLLKVSVAV